ncbi:MAG: methyltransferase domain-containing protein [Acidobacteriota bacterium]
MTPISACRSCSSTSLVNVLDLGSLPLANGLLRGKDLDRTEDRFPLTLLFCGSCALVQIRETVSPSRLFRDYCYQSSFSETMLAHARQASNSYIERFGLTTDSFVVEIASNDGYLLKNFVDRNIPVLGIDPAENIAPVARSRGVPTLVAFFDLDVARRLAASGPRADLILASNVLAHVADLDGMVAGIAELLTDDGVAVVEFPYVGDMLDRVEFDTIYHEHLCYFSAHAVESLLSRHGLRLADVEHLGIHGGSLRATIRRRVPGHPASGAVERLLAEERHTGRLTVQHHLDFAGRVAIRQAEITGELARRRAAGQKLAAYGASAKGSTLMNSCGLGAETLEYVVDRSPVKQGLFTPGNHLPILSPEVLSERQPDGVLLLTWNFAEEILAQQHDYLSAGGEFIIPGSPPTIARASGREPVPTPPGRHRRQQ